MGSVEPLVVEYLRDGPAFAELIADEIGVAVASVKSALYRGNGKLFRQVGDIRKAMLAHDEGPFTRGRPNVMWALIDDYPVDIPGCPD